MRGATDTRRRSGSLLLLASLFFASAGLRLASAPDDTAWKAFAMLLPSPAGAAQDHRENEAEVVPDLLAALQAREADIERRERAVAEQQRALEIAREEVQANLAALADAEAALRETIALADGAAQDDLDRLTRMYETMKPKEAAALFETMDPTFAAGFIAQMSPAAAGAIMEGLPPEIAYTVSLVLAGRNMNVPPE